MPPLLQRLSERAPENLDYLGVSYGVTPLLFKFWKRAGFVPLYMRQTTNDLTGEHSCVMIRGLNKNMEETGRWLGDFAVGTLSSLFLIRSEVRNGLDLSNVHRLPKTFHLTPLVQVPRVWFDRSSHDARSGQLWRFDWQDSR